MELISVDCPSCGAQLPSAPASGEYRCSYCGNGFRLDQAKKAQTQAGIAVDPHAIAAAIIEAQRKAADAAGQPDPQQPGLGHASRPSGGSGGLVVGLVAMLAVVGLVGAGVVYFAAAEGGVEGPPSAAQENVQWDNAGGVPQVVEVELAVRTRGDRRPRSAAIDGEAPRL